MSEPQRQGETLQSQPGSVQAKHGDGAHVPQSNRQLRPGTRWRETAFLRVDVRTLQHRGPFAPDVVSRVTSDLSTLLRQPARARAQAQTSNRGIQREATSEATAGPECELIAVEYRECADDQGVVHMCRCELYECATGRFWQCSIMT